MTYESNEPMYFAAQKKETIAKHLYKKVEEDKEYKTSSGYLELLKKSYRLYYGLSKDFKFSAHSIKKEHGKLHTLRTNHYRNMGNHIVNMVTQNRLNFEARSLNNDYKSVTQTRLAKELANTYFREKDFEEAAIEACEIALYQDSCEIEVGWDRLKGIPYIRGNDSAAIMQGDVFVNTYAPLDVIQEPDIKSSERNWVILRKKVNKWDLASLYKKHAKEIIKRSINISEKTFEDFRLHNKSKESDDYIYLYTFYHKKNCFHSHGAYD